MQLDAISIQTIWQYPYSINSYPSREVPQPGIKILVYGTTGREVLICYLIA